MQNVNHEIRVALKTLHPSPARFHFGSYINRGCPLPLMVAYENGHECQYAAETHGELLTALLSYIKTKGQIK